MSAIRPALTAIYSALNGDSTLLALATGGVFDKVPQETALPYIQIGNATETRFNCFGKKGKDMTLTIHIYDNDLSTRRGYKRCLEILERMNTLLDYVTFTVTGYTTVYVRYEDSSTLLEPDGYTRHIPARYRLIVQTA